MDKQDERRGLFRLLANQLKIQTGVYPGSFVHITPAFYIPEMVFIDSDRRIDRFFKDKETHDYINTNKTYDGKPHISWAQADYTKISDLQKNYYEIMFSFFAGFVSQACKKFLRPGGILVANNSHGDASLAIADTDYDPIGVIERNGATFKIKTESIEDYLLKEDESPIDIDKVKQHMKGEKFRKDTYAYVFKKR